MIELDDPTPKDPNDAEVAALLQTLQGNILKSHGRDGALYLFFKFRAADAACRAALGNLARASLTSASKQHAEAIRFIQNDEPGGVFHGILLAKGGYTALGLNAKVIAPSTSYFGRGMQSSWSRQLLGDPPLASWDPKFQKQIDLLVLLADDDPQRLEQHRDAVVQALAVVADLVGEQAGTALRRGSAKERFEHFGYVDGISQPTFFADQLDPAAPAQHWSSAAPLGLALVPDPFVAGSYGSFFVLRKLEQDVDAFHRNESALAVALGLPPQQAELAGALMIGRFRDGTPVLHSPRPGHNPPLADDFTFDGDSRRRCPVHAHIRKTNTRDSVERGRRIVRRGISYDDRPEDQRNDPRPVGDVGLLFGCFQASIRAQFAHIQSMWAHAPGFPALGTGLDPLASTRANALPHAWPTRWGQAETQAHSLDNVVRMKGGEFFFAPSVTFLQSL
jgi:Dyp-type peroxidase family